MIRALKKQDADVVCEIINNNWKTVYGGYLNAELLAGPGCVRREEHLKQDLYSGRLSEYVAEENGAVVGMLSFGETADADKVGAFEVWRIYLAPKAQGQGLGGRLLEFAETQARAAGYREIVIWAFRENRHAVAFYQKHGYRPEKEEYLGDPYQAFGIRLHKKIPSDEP
jgi:ribosomal protein S18 acetylase RimI-like enzyme